MTEFEQLIHEYTYSNKDLFSERSSKREQRYKEYLDLENLASTKETAQLINNIAVINFEKNNPLKVVEIGSGIGGLAIAIALLGPHNITGIEPEESAVKASRLRAGRYPDIRANFIQGYGEKIPLPDNSFDLVYSQSVLEHVADVPKVIAEAYRILRPGGVIYVETPNYLWPTEQHYRIFFPPLLPKSLAHLYLKQRGKNPAGIDTINYVTPWNISRNLKKTGFIKVTDSAFDEYILKLSDLSRIKHKKYLRIILKIPFSSSLSSVAIQSMLKLGLYPGLKISAQKPIRLVS